jgi:hypothetical protein
MSADVPLNNNFPSYTYLESPGDKDFDFNLLSEYLFNEENEEKAPDWNIVEEELNNGAPNATLLSPVGAPVTHPPSEGNNFFLTELQ